MAGDLIYYDEVHRIIGAAMEVYNRVGPGVSEAVYQECLCLELDAMGVPFESEAEIEIFYRGQQLAKKYRVDIVCYDDIIIELKAVDAILPEHKAQLLNYLKLTNKSLGLLLNFGKRVEFQRFVNAKEHFNENPMGILISRD